VTAAATTQLPAILLANDLRSGAVVFWAGEAWSIDPMAAEIARDQAAAERLQQAADAGLAAQQVVDAYLVDVLIREDGVPVPNHFRERFKLLGPSIRLDLGKQAEFPRLVAAARN